VFVQVHELVSDAVMTCTRPPPPPPPPPSNEPALERTPLPPTADTVEQLLPAQVPPGPPNPPLMSFVPPAAAVLSAE